MKRNKSIADFQLVRELRKRTTSGIVRTISRLPCPRPR